MNMKKVITSMVTAAVVLTAGTGIATAEDSASVHRDIRVTHTTKKVKKHHKKKVAKKHHYKSHKRKHKVKRAYTVHDRFIKAGGTQALWSNIVMYESGGNPYAQNGRYHGLGQTDKSWGYGSVEHQTKGMLHYIYSRYGSIQGAINFRYSHGWY
jgi:hypothetical protein